MARPRKFSAADEAAICLTALSGGYARAAALWGCSISTIHGIVQRSRPAEMSTTTADLAGAIPLVPPASGAITGHIGVAETKGPWGVAYRSAPRARSTYDLLAILREAYVFHDSPLVERLIRENPAVLGPLQSAVPAIESVFGAGRTLLLVASDDWEGTPTLTIMVEFGGSGEEASELCRRFTRDWLVNQAESTRRLVTIDVQFV